MKRGKVWTAGLALCLVAGLGACSGESSSRQGGSGAQEGAVEIRWTRGENPAQAIKENTPVIQEILAKTNVKIDLEPVPGSNYGDKKRVLLASNNIPDVIGIEAGDAAEFGDTGMFLAISDYLDQMPNFQKVMEEHPEIGKLFVDGKLYSLPITEQFKIQGGKAPMIRADILEELQLEVPASFDDLYTVLKRMKEAYPDSYPFTTRGMSFMDAFSLGMGSGYGMTYDDANDRYFYGQNKPEFKEVLTYLNRLYSEQLLDPDFAVNTKQNWDEKLSTGRSFFYYDNNSFAVNYNATLQQNAPDAKFDRIPYLTNAAGEAKGWLYPKGWLVDNYAISSKTKNPEAVIAMFDWMYGEEGTRVTNYGVEGETFEIQNGEAEMLPETIEKYKSSSDPARVMMSELGTGLLALAVHVDESPIKQLSDPDLVRWGEELTADEGAYYVPGLNPAFTAEETDKLKQYTTKTSPLEEDVVKFIIGTKPLEDFDQWAGQLTDAGAGEIEKIYNDALNRTK
ncbi:extracellular solute-binding protein [Saccharibacillus sp. CPCC 101409]|uniref:extracellular solute-binding protein n=1 Tax=Saccharibacillus sp. CPCC 101409 TaxID=3058041 RepID=UPI002672375F|nr:extracellular solute-binding protein [Saccharibacillus sp. CPCC 101409]MDO3412458.1 extracellular solute-binding protein [Saccharibacillus sp. CPCC 101409]